jgi:cytochrome c oxidase assembly protein subunit 11
MTERKKHKKIFVIGGIVAFLMFGFAFAMVPLYNLICKQTGINTTIAGGTLLTQVSAKTTEPPDLTRTIEVQFVSVNHNGMPWDFFPRIKSVQVHPGENNTIYYFAKNTTGKTMSVQAIPSMTPPDAISHFHKIQCFCFTQQTLKSNESKEMPMIFRIDNEISKNVKVITLAYTLFDTTQEKRKV